MREDVAKSKTHGSDIGLVDVGCNIGLFTLTAALNGYRVLAIDAMNSSLQLVATSLRLANLTSRVTMLHNAISDRHRDVVVQVRLPNNIGASWVLQASSDKDNNTQNVDTQTVVKAICLDDLVDYVPTRRIFLKMDIEASEWLALRSESNEAMNTGVVNTQTVVKAICLDDLVPYVPTRRIFLKMDIEGSEWLALRCADRFFSELDVPYFHMEWDLSDRKASSDINFEQI
nr:hypothetical protein BaRGS_031292 [Batillaria attramentaria]